MASQALLWVDETVEQYQDMHLPSNWTIRYEPVWGGIAKAMRWTFENYPNASQYGWLADDFFPQTPYWDKALEGAAGDWRISHGKDRFYSSNRYLEGLLHTGQLFGAPICWGGRLVRAAEFWAIPEVRMAGIDTAWSALAHGLGINSYLPEIVCRHDHYSTGRRPKDETDSWIKDGADWYMQDISIRDRWIGSPELGNALQRIQEAMSS